MATRFAGVQEAMFHVKHCAVSDLGVVSIHRVFDAALNHRERVIPAVGGRARCGCVEAIGSGSGADVSRETPRLHALQARFRYTVSATRSTCLT